MGMSLVVCVESLRHTRTMVFTFTQFVVSHNLLVIESVLFTSPLMMEWYSVRHSSGDEDGKGE